MDRQEEGAGAGRGDRASDGPARARRGPGGQEKAGGAGDATMVNVRTGPMRPAPGAEASPGRKRADGG